MTSESQQENIQTISGFIGSEVRCVSPGYIDGHKSLEAL